MKFLVIGLGSMGKRRIRNLKRLDQHDVIGVDLRPDRREEASSLYGIRALADFDEAMAHQPDALIISTPPDQHMMFARPAVQSGKHFFSEANTTARGMEQVVRMVRKKGLVAAASCTMRHHPSIRKLKEIVQTGAVGSILTYTHHAGQWLPDWHPNEDYRQFYVSRRETSACREIVPFELTWLNWIVGSGVRRVTAMKDKLSDLDCDIDDVYQLLLQYEDGTIGHLQVDVLARAPVRHCRIVGSRGTLEWSLTERVVRHYDAVAREWVEHSEPPPRVEPGYSEMSNEAMYEAEIAAYLDAICGRAPWGHPLEEEIATIDVLIAAERAADAGRTQILK